MTEPISPRPAPFREALALVFAMSFPTFLSYLVFFVFPNSAREGNLGLQAVFGVGKAIQFLFPLAYVAIWDRAALRASPPTWRGMRVGITFSLVVALAAFALYFLLLRGSPLFAQTSGKVQHWMAQFNLPSAAGFWALAAFVCVVHSLWEEYYWRWFVFGRLRPWMPWQAAAVLAGLAFMAHHVVVLSFYLPRHFWVGVVPFSLGVAVGGIVWAWMYQRYGSLYATWVSHCLVDLGVMVIGYDLLMIAQNGAT